MYVVEYDTNAGTRYVHHEVGAHTLMDVASVLRILPTTAHAVYVYDKIRDTYTQVMRSGK